MIEATKKQSQTDSAVHPVFILLVVLVLVFLVVVVLSLLAIVRIWLHRKQKARQQIKPWRLHERLDSKTNTYLLQHDSKSVESSSSSHSSNASNKDASSSTLTSGFDVP